MLIQSLIISSAILAAQQPQTPPRPTPETRPPAPAPQDPGARTGERGQADKAVPAPDTAFVKKAAEGGMAEVELAKLAQEKAENADVKAFAAKLEKDHTQANDELKAIAGRKQLTLPTALSKMHENKKAKLSKLSGAEFDRAYVAEMLQDHQKDVKEFQREASTGADADVKAFAAKTLPTLKEHLQQVQELSKTVGKKPTS